MRGMERDITKFPSFGHAFGPTRRNVTRLIRAVTVGTLFHATACIIARPLEFGDGSRVHTFFCATVSGLLTFPIVFAALLLPLQALVQWCLPRNRRSIHGILVGIALLALVAVWILVRFFSGVTLPPYCHGYLWHSLFWCSFVTVVVAAFFWPVDSQD
jgi:hypothetical protein